MKKNFSLLFFLYILSYFLCFTIVIFPETLAHKLDDKQYIKQNSFSYAPLVKLAAPAVVNIYTKKIQKNSSSPFASDPFFRKFFEEFFPPGKSLKKINSLGSGVIIDSEGFIVTNNHVVQDSSNILVSLADRREFDAKIVISDPRTDLAILKITNKNSDLPYLELMNSDELEVGDIVLAIGNPFGVGQTVTSGIISALARTKVGVGDYEFFIQTDAAINPGNSGGALVTSTGKLAGINTAIFSRTGGSVGIGFAIPSNMVASVINSVKESGKIIRPWIGLYGKNLNRELSERLGIEKKFQGLLVTEINARSSFNKAGIKINDVIISFNNIPIVDFSSLSYRVAISKIGQIVSIKILRNEELIDLKVKLSPPPETPRKNITEIIGESPLSGSKIANLSPALAEELGINSLKYSSGIIILSVSRFSRSYNVSLRPGDIIKEINGKKIKRIRDLKPILDKDTKWIIIFMRGEREYRLSINKK